MCAYPCIRAPKIRGVIGHHATLAHVPTMLCGGLPTATPATLFLQCATLLSLNDLVAVPDALILQPVGPEGVREGGLATLAELTAGIRSERVTGKRPAQEALDLARCGVESRTETLLRLLIVCAGLPEPIPGLDIVDSTGRFLARADLTYPEWKIIVEYDGDQHRSSTSQYERDMARLDLLRDAGWKVIRVRMRGLFVAPDATVAQIRTALRSRGWRS